MTSHSCTPTIYTRAPRHIPFGEARRRLLEAFEVEHVRALMARHHGDVAAGSHAAGMSQRQRYALLRRREQTHPSNRWAMRRWLPERPRWLAPRWLMRATVVLLAVLTCGCQGELGSVDGAWPDGALVIQCFGPVERRNEVCGPLRIGVMEASDGKVQRGLERAYSDCVEVFDIAGQLCDKSAASQPSPCLDVLEDRLPCFDLPQSAMSEKEHKERDRLLRDFDECTDRTQSQVEACFDDNFEPGEASCDALEGHTICGELLDAADDAKAQADREHILTSYEICIAYVGQAYSECAVGECRAVSDTNGVCQLLLDATYRVESGKLRDRLEDDFVACAKEFIEIERECIGDEKSTLHTAATIR